MKSRKAVHAYLSDEAHDQWQEFAATQGVSVSAILEALAPEFSGAADGEFDKLIKEARRIDARRRRRSTTSVS